MTYHRKYVKKHPLRGCNLVQAVAGEEVAIDFKVTLLLMGSQEVFQFSGDGKTMENLGTMGTFGKKYAMEVS